MNQRKKAIYYSIVANATPDVSHQEQNIIILRYGFRNETIGVFNIFKRFIEFINFNKKTREDIPNQLIFRLECFKIPLLNCRS